MGTWGLLNLTGSRGSDNTHQAVFFVHDLTDSGGASELPPANKLFPRNPPLLKTYPKVPHDGTDWLEKMSGPNELQRVVSLTHDSNDNGDAFELPLANGQLFSNSDKATLQNLHRGNVIKFGSLINRQGKQVVSLINDLSESGGARQILFSLSIRMLKIGYKRSSRRSKVILNFPKVSGHN